MGCVGEAFFAYAVVGGLAVFEAFAAGYVREGEEEVIDVVVARIVGGSGLADEIAEFGEERGAELGVFRRKRLRLMVLGGFGAFLLAILVAVLILRR